jgi:hypothetical protein
MSKKTMLWIAAVIVLAVPYFFMQSGNARMVSAGTQAALVGMMRHQSIQLMMTMGERLGYGPIDQDRVKALVGELNAMNRPPSPEELAELRKQGVNTNMMPKPIPRDPRPREGRTQPLIGLRPSVRQLHRPGLGPEPGCSNLRSKISAFRTEELTAT